MIKQGNRGYIKHEDKIIKTFISMFKNKHQSKICVEEILKEADICRTTFYKHFHSIEDIYVGVEKYIANEFCKIMFKDFKKTVNNLDKWFDELFKKIQKNIDFYSSLVYSSHLSGIVERICQEISLRAQKFAQSKNGSDNDVQLICLVIYGTMGAILNAIVAKLKNNVNVSWESVNRFCSDLFYGECGQYLQEIGLLDKDKKDYWNKSNKK